MHEAVPYDGQIWIWCAWNWLLLWNFLFLSSCRYVSDAITAPATIEKRRSICTSRRAVLGRVPWWLFHVVFYRHLITCAELWWITALPLLRTISRRLRINTRSFNIHTLLISPPIAHLSIPIGFLGNVLQRDDWKSYFLNFFFSAMETDSIDRKSIADHPKVITFQKTSSAFNRINNSRLNSLIRNLSEIYRKLTSFGMGINCWISHESSEF